MRIALLFLAACSGSAPSVAIDGAVVEIDSPPSRPEDSPHLTLGIPQDGTPDDDHLLVHPQFAAGYSRYLNAANWVSWRTRPQDFGPAPRYEGPFYPDEMLPAEWWRPDTDNYFGPGYDRGHMLRSEERTDTVAHNIETFVMTNVLPQTADLNRGVWFDYEQHVQWRVQSKNEDAYVIAGGVWPAACATHAPRVAGDGCPDFGRSTDPARRIAVPNAYWKIVAFVPAGSTFDASTALVEAIVMPNIDGVYEHRWWQYKSTVAAIEAMTGYDVLAP